MAPVAAAFILALAVPAFAAQSATDVNSRPIRKVITLLEDMKAQVEKDAQADLTAYDKYMCWCKTNKEEKTAAVEIAEKRIDALATTIEEAAAKEGELKTEISGLLDDISEDKDALATATLVREEENKAFLAAEADMKETRHLLGEAISTLSKVQLAQRRGGSVGASKEAAAALIQVRDFVQQRFPKFQGVMQRDLFDVLGSLQGLERRHRQQGGAFLGEQAKLLPWEKTVEQVGKESNPNDLKGAAAGAKSYNSRSGGILGILASMKDQFTRDLGDAQKTDFKAEVQFQSLRAAKLSEIMVATKLNERKEAALADVLDASAKAKEDKEATEEAMAADESFLGTLAKNCKAEDEEYADRLSVRNEELRALSEALKILNEDTARELYDKTMSFVQVGSGHRALSTVKATAREAVKRSMQRIAEVARRHRNLALASIAADMQLDAFTKVKAAMDKMLAELEKQQKEEYEKWELCKKDIDTTEDSIKVETHNKEDLAEKHQAQTNTIATLRDEIAALKKDVEELEISLKQAGEERKEQSQVFQTSITDQRATTNILKKAEARLKQFYLFTQVSARGRQEPGAPAPPPPPSPKGYQKSAGAGGVLQVFAMVIKDAEVAEVEIEKTEQKAQADYAVFVQSATSTIEADREAIEKKEAQAAEAESAKSETEGSQLSNDEELAKLRDLLKAHHVDCDYVLQFFDVRQKSRAEEMDAITDAKAILSGSVFSK